MSTNFGLVLRGGEFADDQRNEIGREFTVVETLGVAETAGGVAAVLNPFGVAVIVTDVIINLTTVSTGAGTVDAGIAANATTSSDTLIDGVNVNAAVGVFDNQADRGTNGGLALWAADRYLTVSKASGSVAGMAGKLYIKGIQSL